MRHIKRFVVLFLLVLLLPVNSFAQSCSDQDPCIGISDLQQKTTCYQNVSNACRSQRDTLSSQINYMNSQIQLMNLRINATKTKINTLYREIDELENEVQRLEGVLNTRLTLLAHRIPIAYKRASLPQFGLLLFSSNISDFIFRVKYLSTIQREDAALVFQVKATQNSYNESKVVREDKKTQLEDVKTELERQNQQLAQQTLAKNALLSATQGNESRYQQLMEQAKEQLAAFRGFVQSQGGLTLITADPNWPSGYFSERDVRWGSLAIAGPYSSGATVFSIGQAGCLISSVAMALSHRGTTTTPGNIGSNYSYFFDANFLWSGLNSLGFGVQRTLNTSIIDNSLSQGKWVIVGISYLNRTDTQPFHFVVVTGKNGSDYNLFDPWEGPNTSYNGRYGSNYITEIITY